MKIITHETPACLDIGSAAEEIVIKARSLKCYVVTEFNGINLTASPSDNARAVVERWDLELYKRESAKAEIEQLERKIKSLKESNGLIDRR